MPVYHIKDKELQMEAVIVAKSEHQARLHFNRTQTCKKVSAAEVAELAKNGVACEFTEAPQ